MYLFVVFILIIQIQLHFPEILNSFAQWGVFFIHGDWFFIDSKAFEAWNKSKQIEIYYNLKKRTDLQEISERFTQNFDDFVVARFLAKFKEHLTKKFPQFVLRYT